MNQLASLHEFDACDLLPGTLLLNGQYEILEPLQKGGFAMTYVARDSLDRNVVIKECFPAGLCVRLDGEVRAISPKMDEQFSTLKQQFICEARGVAKLKHPYVVAVHQVFEENNTAYMALDYVEGIDLISMQEDEPNRLTPAFLDQTLREALKAVRYIHSKGVLHRDIAPDNLRVDQADRITLIDFGAADARTSGTAFAANSLSAVKDGYSPPEFYRPDAGHDFSSDLYSLGATFYLLVTGEVPPSGQLRHDLVAAGAPDPYVPLRSGDWDCSYALALTIDRAMELDRKRRPQTADMWLKALDEAPLRRPAQQRPVRQTQLADSRELEAVLSQLVLDVNRNLTTENRARAQAAARPEISQTGAEKPRKDHWVDLFGNPIVDVESWRIEQEIVVAPEPEEPPEELLEPVVELQPEAPVAAELIPEPQCEAPARKSLLRSLISRCLTRRAEGCLT